MDPSFLVERLLAIGGLLLAAAFFAGSETALFSLSRVQREAMATREDKGVAAALELLSHPRRLIVTIIVCNELINIANSSLGGDAGGAPVPHRPRARAGGHRHRQ